MQNTIIMLDVGRAKIILVTCFGSNYVFLNLVQEIYQIHENFSKGFIIG